MEHHRFIEESLELARYYWKTQFETKDGFDMWFEDIIEPALFDALKVARTYHEEAKHALV